MLQANRANGSLPSYFQNKSMLLSCFFMYPEFHMSTEHKSQIFSCFLLHSISYSFATAKTNHYGNKCGCVTAVKPDGLVVPKATVVLSSVSYTRCVQCM